MLVGRRREMGRETSYTTTAHWTCAFCGALVGHGDYHVCAGSAPLAPIAPVVMNRDAEIIDALRPLPRWAKRVIWFFYPFLREQG